MILLEKKAVIEEILKATFSKEVMTLVFKKMTLFYRLSWSLKQHLTRSKNSAEGSLQQTFVLPHKDVNFHLLF